MLARTGASRLARFEVFNKAFKTIDSLPEAQLFTTSTPTSTGPAEFELYEDFLYVIEAFLLTEQAQATLSRRPRGRQYRRHDPVDAIATAAQLLIEDKGAPRGKDIDAYQGSGPQAEADRVMADAHTYQAGANRVTDSSSGAGCGDAGLSFRGPAGKVAVAPGADRPGVSVQPIVLEYVAAMAGLAGRPIVTSIGPSTAARPSTATSPNSGTATPPTSA